MTCRQRREVCVWSLRYVGWIVLHCGEAKCFSLTSCRRWLPPPVITRSSSVALQTWLIRINTLNSNPFSRQLLQSVSVVRGERKKLMQVYCLSNFDIWFFFLLCFSMIMQPCWVWPYSNIECAPSWFIMQESARDCNSTFELFINEYAVPSSSWRP